MNIKQNEVNIVRAQTKLFNTPHPHPNTYIQTHMKKLTLIILLLFVSCERDQICYCTETTTNTIQQRVYVDEYWIDNCDSSFTVVETYYWGNKITDCR